MVKLARALMAGIAILAAAPLACVSEEPMQSTSDASAINVVWEDVPVALPGVGEVVTSETHHAVMAALETQLRFDTMLLAQEGTGGTAERVDTLAEHSSWYASVAASLEADLNTLSSTSTFTYGAEPYTNRLFNAGWLRSPYAFFELTAVVPRVDRMDFSGEGCGELRLIYRMAYDDDDVHPPLYSRLPLTVNVVFDMLGSRADGCASVAQRFQVDQTLSSATAYSAWLRDRANVSDGSRYRFRQLEVNMQAMRVPSESKSDLGGHAEYFLRVYAPSGNGLALAKLENTPDVDRINQDPALRSELASYIQSHADVIDRGVMQLPEKFLATKVTSFSTFGLHRRANRPFSQIFSPSDLAATDLTAAEHAATPEALLLRLDNMTCSGCHQGGSVAGFHLIGDDRPDRALPFNAVRLAGSPHFAEEEKRRSDYSLRLLAGQEVDRFRPLSFTPTGDAPAPAGGRCFTASAAEHFKHSHDCDAGLTCRSIADDGTAPAIGMCVRPDSESVAGDPCWSGTMTEGAEPRSDRLSRRRFGCSAYSCLKPEEGTPAGLCIKGCGSGNSPRNEHEMCAYNGGASFDACATTGNFASCMLTSIRRGLRAACDESQPCRDDYICQRFYEVDGQRVTVPADDRGFCVPTYFLYQMRLDGHPHHPEGEPPFIGDACETSDACAFESGDHAGTCALGSEGGVCTLSCEGPCPDRPGHAPTFCTSLDGGETGSCLPKATEHNDACAELPGTQAETRERHVGSSGASEGTAEVCVPI